MCGALTGDELLSLSAHTRLVTHHAGEELAGEKMPVEAYATVISGVVKLTKTLEDGRQQIVGLQFAPDFLGRLHANENGVSAEAASDVHLCRVPKAAMERLVKSTPALAERLMEQTMRELDEARDWMVTLGRKTAAEKVASFLFLIATHLDPEATGENRRFDLPLSRADIADFLGLTIETVSRQMSKLKADGVISIVANRHIEVAKLSKLKACCGT
ncbi:MULTISPECIES: Crp/Fnr family transcriptional regulator [unclassified Rhizobium]|jgi:CRP/FNR family transcriptional regulator|uniref:Crp/Fnr family transcriptional regulator n=1 Tax=unclassified Rhizobium TaxID=2613769 RepID=UPI000DD8E076|nr:MULTISPECIES: Crp/Fnr family transcriptional regulator [unclassified Rhizobium]MDM9644744.1 Crp/Fnr family transcriptional regulator [Rhizobium sp. S163]